jgi:hypothetical protein
MLLLVLFLRNCIRTMHTNLLSGDILFADTPRVIVMFQHDFGQGGGTPLSRCLQEERLVAVVVSMALFINIIVNT